MAKIMRTLLLGGGGGASKVNNTFGGGCLHTHAPTTRRHARTGQPNG